MEQNLLAFDYKVTIMLKNNNKIIFISKGKPCLIDTSKREMLELFYWENVVKDFVILPNGKVEKISNIDSLEVELEN